MVEVEALLVIQHYVHEAVVVKDNICQMPRVLPLLSGHDRNVLANPGSQKETIFALRRHADLLHITAPVDFAFDRQAYGKITVPVV